MSLILILIALSSIGQPSFPRSAVINGTKVVVITPNQLKYFHLIDLEKKSLEKREGYLQEQLDNTISMNSILERRIEIQEDKYKAKEDQFARCDIERFRYKGDYEEQLIKNEKLKRLLKVAVGVIVIESIILIIK